MKYNGKHLSDANIPLPTKAAHSRIVKNSAIKKYQIYLVISKNRELKGQSTLCKDSALQVHCG